MPPMGRRTHHHRPQSHLLRQRRRARGRSLTRSRVQSERRVTPRPWRLTLRKAHSPRRCRPRASPIGRRRPPRPEAQPRRSGGRWSESGGEENERQVPQPHETTRNHTKSRALPRCRWPQYVCAAGAEYRCPMFPMTDDQQTNDRLCLNRPIDRSTNRPRTDDQPASP